MRRIQGLVIGCILLAAPAAMAEQVDLEVDGQVRVRYEWDEGRDFADDAKRDWFGQRTRLGVKASVAQHMELYVQLQDVRLWGEEANTLGDYSADGLDIHQAYGDVEVLGGSTLRVGRQEVLLANQRLIGNVGWANQARSFDGIRLMRDEATYEASLFYLQLLEDDSAVGAEEESTLYGLHTKLKMIETFPIDVLLIMEENENETSEVERYTVGALGTLKTGGLSGHLEGYYQGGELSMSEDAEQDIAAMLFSVGAGYALDVAWSPSVYVYLDYLSGDDDPSDDESTVFNTLYATNHKFYGFMDFFLNIPAHTGGGGLMDLALRLKVKPCEKSALMVDLHQFTLAEEDAAGEDALGMEVDATYSYKACDWVAVQAGISYFTPDKAMENLKGVGDDSEDEMWWYAMTNFTF